MNTLKVYAVIVTCDYIPYIELLTTDKEEAIKHAKEYAGDWDNELPDEIYFNQEEDGNMDNSVTVTETEITIK